MNNLFYSFGAAGRRFFIYKSIIRSAAIISVAGMLSACVTSVNRVGADSDIDISGKWNDVDSRQVSDGLTKDFLDKPWYTRYATALDGKLPVLIVGAIRNNSNEHINTETFTKDLEIAVLNSGRMEIVAASNQQDAVRQERLGQTEFSSEETRKALRNELGADIILVGSINTIDDQEGRRSVRYYQVDIELIDIESNRKLWIGQQEIKKFIQRPAARL